MPFTTDTYEAILAETVEHPGQDGDLIRAFLVRPLGEGPFPAVVMIHHLPGWDTWNRETAFRFARNGYIAICPNLYERVGHGTPEDVAAMARSQGGAADDQVVADIEGAIRYVRALPTASGKVGVLGTCSGGRHTMVVASRASERIDAAIDFWGGGVVAAKEDLNDKRPVAPIDMTPDLKAPLLGIFGNDDRSPSPEQVDQHEEALKAAGKDYEFHRYDGAGHGFFYYDRPAYRPEQAVDAWGKVWAFLDKHLKS